MFIRFTPKQLQKTKELLKSSKLNGYDVPIYLEIQKALKDPIDEKDLARDHIVGPGKPKQPVKVETILPTPEPPSVLETPLEEQKSYVGEQQIDPTNPTQYVPEEEYVEEPVGASFQSLKDKLNANKAFTSPSDNLEPVEEVIPPVPPSSDIVENNAPTSDQLEEAGVFGVIDNRTQK